MCPCVTTLVIPTAVNTEVGHFFPFIDLTFLIFSHNLYDLAYETGQDEVVDNEVILGKDITRHQ